MTAAGQASSDDLAALWADGPALRTGLGDRWYAIKPIKRWEQVAALGRSNVERLLTIATERATYVEDRYTLNGVIRILEALRDRLPEQPRKPLLIGLRPTDYYAPGVPIMVHIGTMPNLLVVGDWVEGIVTEDQECVVQYRTAIRIHSKPYMDGFGGNAARCAANAMSVQDFNGMVEAARTDSTFFDLWCSTLDWEGKPLTPVEFKAAMAAPAFASPKAA